MTLKGFNESSEKAMGTITLAFEIDGWATEAKFHIIDAETSFNILLGWLWIDLVQLNSKTLNCFFCALKSEDYMRVSTCKSGKEIWDSLCLTYEGTNEVKQSRMNMLLHDYELFRMLPNEFCI